MSAKNFKDLFSGHAQEYSQFRPTYPPALFSYLGALPGRKERAWDCGTGNGQAAVALAPHFREVMATDSSQAQLDQALAHPKVRYKRAPAEDSGLESGSVDLVTVAQALHWFSLEEFYREVRRVLRPREGFLAVWCYRLSEIDPCIDQVIWTYYQDILGNYWEPERRRVDEGYKNLPFPFEEFLPLRFQMEARWDLCQLMGYLGTWSAAKAAEAALGKDPVDEIREDLTRAWGGPPEEKRKISWPLSLRVGRQL